jgi:hypothetical protein
MCLRFSQSVGPAVAALLASASTLDAQTATQTVTFSVVPASQVALSAATAPLSVRASSRTAPTSASVAGTSYGITTNETNQKITASVDQPMPAGLTLSVALTPPPGAVSAGSTPLRSSAADVVTRISAVSARELPIVYALSGTAVNSSAPSARRVIYTIVAGQ